jgi:DNA polymerase III epsilon subunit-like protein
LLFDLETTGIDIGKDRIVEISILKVFPNGNKESKTWLVNPTIPIPPQTTAVHGSQMIKWQMNLHSKNWLRKCTI